MALHIVKLCVGAESIDDLAQWQTSQAAIARKAKADPRPVCGTRMAPKRADEVLNGGSLYWVIKGIVCVRQRIVEIADVRDEYGLRVGFYLESQLVRTQPQPRRAFQGWRYLDPKDAPRDLLDAAGGENNSGEGLPDELRRQLVALGAW